MLQQAINTAKQSKAQTKFKVVVTMGVNQQWASVRVAGQSKGINASVKGTRGCYHNPQVKQVVKYCTTQTQLVKWLSVLFNQTYHTHYINGSALRFSAAVHKLAW